MMGNNDIQHIKKLLHAFYDGATSLEEEKELTQYFLGENVVEELILDQIFFIELSSAQKQSSLEKKIEELIDKLDVEERTETLPAKLKLLSLNRKWLGGIAASVLIMICGGIYIHNNDREKMMVDTYSNPEEAYIETQKALILVSSKLNKGFDQMMSAQKNLEKTNKIIAKNIEL